KPLGFNDYFEIFDFEKYPLYTEYNNFDIDKIVKLINDDVSNIKIDSEGNIQKIFFYNDASNPSVHSESWGKYFKIVEELSKLNRKVK
ncbi:MAG: hypothetical protein GXO84_04415, partial [Chlorobi bacterium]|nr:hypothetical protein [Chlorobiota bacterium]